MYKRNNQGWIKHLDFIILDVLTLQLAFVIAYMLRQKQFILPYSVQPYRALAITCAVIDILVCFVFNTMHNVLKRGYYQEFKQSVIQSSMVLACLTIYMFYTKSGDEYSRIMVFLTACFHFSLGFLTRLLWKVIISHISSFTEKSRMILVADERIIPEIISRKSIVDDFEYVGIILINRNAKGEVVERIPVVADLADAADYICREWVDEVFIYPASLAEFETDKGKMYDEVEGFIDAAIIGNLDSRIDCSEYDDGRTLASFVEQCRQMAIPIHIRLPISNIGGKSFIEKVGGYNVLTSTVNYVSPLQIALKRCMDIVGGLVGSVIALLVMAVVGPKIKKESPGPILFKQTRVGLNGQKFQIYKIRSMYMDAEDRKNELLAENRVSDGMMFKLDWDPRIIGNKEINGKKVTGIGEKIRSGSWDEWPQFFNVLKGEMSLVGTRPPTEDEWEKYKYHHRARLAVKPGITGMWQVNGRSKITDFEEVVRLDTEYINNWSIALDIKILLKTVKVVFTRDGAM